MLPAVAGEGVAGRASDVAAAARALEMGEGTLVIVSPHGDRAGIYRTARGSLGAKGVDDVRIEMPTDEGLGERLADKGGLGVIAGEIDHGIMVPLLLLERLPSSVVAVSVTTEMEAKSFVGALIDAHADEVSFIASVNTSAALDPRAPLTYRPEAERVEQRLLADLPRDALAAADLAGELESGGGSCSAAPLVAFGILFAGCPVDVRAYQQPFGVGYLVATTERDV